MNVTDQWMLERMQQMAANMAASLPQVNQNADQQTPDKDGVSFKDMMDKAKDQKVEAPKKDTAPAKKEPVQSKEFRKTEPNQDGNTDAPQKVELTAEQAAMVAAGYAKLFVQDDGTVMIVTTRDENGNLVLPLAELEDANSDYYAFRAEVLADTDKQWTVEPTPELVTALEQLLKENNDPRTVDVVLGKLMYNKDGTPIEPKVEVTIETPEAKQSIGMEWSVKVVETDDPEEDTDGLSAELMPDSQPLFKDVKAAPVKVGENFQLDTEQPDMDSQLAQTVQLAAQQGLKEIEIKLSPENLGALTVKLTESSDGVLQVVLHTSNTKAANLLSQHLDGLNAALQGYGQNEVRVEVQRNDGSQQASQQQQHQTDPDGHNQQQQQQQQRQQENEHSGDFIQKLRLGLFRLEDVL